MGTVYISNFTPSAQILLSSEFSNLLSGLSISFDGLMIVACNGLSDLEYILPLHFDHHKVSSEAREDHRCSLYSEIYGY